MILLITQKLMFDEHKAVVTKFNKIQMFEYNSQSSRPIGPTYTIMMNLVPLYSLILMLSNEHFSRLLETCSAQQTMPTMSMLSFARRQRVSHILVTCYFCYFVAFFQAPLVQLLQRNKLSPKDVDAVELLGGGSRVPRLQAVLSDALDGRYVYMRV